MLARYPAQIYAVFQKMIFWGKFVSTAFNHYLHGHAKFWQQNSPILHKNSQSGSKIRWCYLYTLNTDKMVKAYKYTSVFLAKCLKCKFPGLQYACNLRIKLCYTNSSHFQFVLDRGGEGPYSKINEVLLHYYFLLQCTLKYHINITPHPLHTQAYFFPKIFHSEQSYFNNRLLILREIFDRIFSKTRNHLTFEMF